MKRSFSVVVPSYNSWRTIGRTLESIARQTRPDLVAETIVVDSSDDVRTAEFLKSVEAPGLRVIRAGTRVIPALGRNIGAEVASGDVVVFVDSDVVLSEEWLERVSAAMDAGCRVGGGSVDVPSFQRSNPVALAQLFLQFSEYLPSGKRRVKPFVPSCSLFCERALFLESGGFPNLRASEDVMFCLELGRREPIWFAPEARAFHVFREDPGAFLRNQVLLGEYIAVYRKMRGGLKNVPSALLAAPATAIKCARVAGRSLSAGFDRWIPFLFSFPHLLVGLISWGLGFSRAGAASNAAASH